MSKKHYAADVADLEKNQQDFVCGCGLSSYVVFAVLIFYIFTIIGLFVLRRTSPDAERSYKPFVIS